MKRFIGRTCVVVHLCGRHSGRYWRGPNSREDFFLAMMGLIFVKQTPLRRRLIGMRGGSQIGLIINYRHPQHFQGNVTLYRKTKNMSSRDNVDNRENGHKSRLVRAMTTTARSTSSDGNAKCDLVETANPAFGEILVPKPGRLYSGFARIGRIHFCKKNSTESESCTVSFGGQVRND